jgi:hypothetical protein
LLGKHCFHGFAPFLPWVWLFRALVRRQIASISVSDLRSCSFSQINGPPIMFRICSQLLGIQICVYLWKDPKEHNFYSEIISDSNFSLEV